MIHLAIFIVAVWLVLCAASALLEFVGWCVGGCVDAWYGDGKSVEGKEIGDQTPAEACDWLRRYGL